MCCDDGMTHVSSCPARVTRQHMMMLIACRWPGGKMDQDDAGEDQESEDQQQRMRRSQSSAGTLTTGSNAAVGHLEVGQLDDLEVPAKKLSREHRTALAKLKDVFDWLTGMLEG